MKALMKTVAVAALISSAQTDENVNLTADVRAKQATGACGAPTITGEG